MKSLLVLAALAGVAHADRTIGVLDVRVEGVAAEAKAKFSEGLEQQLAASPHAVMSAAKMHEAMASSAKFTDGCITGPCLQEIRAQTKADMVLLVAFTGLGTTYGYVVTLMRTDTGQVLSQHADRCDVCTLNEAMGKAQKATLELVDKMPAQLPDDQAAAQAQVAAAILPYRREAEVARRHPKKLGTGLVVAGGIVTIAGIVALVVNSGRTETAITAAGAGLLVGGVTVLAF